MKHRKAKRYITKTDFQSKKRAWEISNKTRSQLALASKNHAIHTHGLWFNHKPPKYVNCKRWQVNISIICEHVQGKISTSIPQTKDLDNYWQSNKTQTYQIRGINCWMLIWWCFQGQIISRVKEFIKSHGKLTAPVL